MKLHVWLSLSVRRIFGVNNVTHLLLQKINKRAAVIDTGTSLEACCQHRLQLLSFVTVA